MTALGLLGAGCSGVDESDIAGLSDTATIRTDESSSEAATDTTADSGTTVAETTTSMPETTTTAAPTTTSTTALDQAPLPDDAPSLALALSETEMLLRADSTDPDDAAPIGRRQQRLYRVLSANPEWAETVLADVDPSVAFAVERNWAARKDLSALVGSATLSSTLPAWQIREPLPAAELLEYYREGEEITGIAWTYLAAINLVETRMGRIEGVSTAGAVGPMQFLPSTWNGCCQGDPTIDRDAIVGAADYLSQVGGPGDMQRALFSYNQSQRYVDAVQAYSDVLAADARALAGYHAWEVYFLSSAGLIRMPVGYDEVEPVDAAEWLAANPDAAID